MRPYTIPHKKKPHDRLKTATKSTSSELPREQIFSFSHPDNNPETTFSPLLKFPESTFKKAKILPQKALSMISQKFHDFSHRLLGRSHKTVSEKNVPQTARQRAKSSILDLKASKMLNKGSLMSSIVAVKNMKNNSANDARKSSILLFENFTGRKVSENEYYEGSPKLNPLGKVEYYKAEKKIDRIKRLQLHGRKLKYPFLIIPVKSKFKFYWDLLIICLIFMNSLLNPLEIAFQQQDNNVYLGFNFSVILFYIVDIIFSMRTTYYDENNDEILEGMLLFKNYIKSKAFLIDMISGVPWSEIIEYSLQNTSKITYIKFINLLKFIRLLRLSRIFFYFKDDSYKTLFQIAKIILMCIITFHWASCLWLFLILLQYDGPDINQDFNSWLPINYRTIENSVSSPTSDFFCEKYYEQDPMYEQYIYTLYSIIMMVIGSEMGTVGVLQTLLAILICIVGSFFYAYFFSEVILLISKLNYAISLYQTKLDELDMKLEKNNIPLPIQDKIHEYYSFYWKKQKIFQNLSDFSKLSESLKREILFHTHKDLVLNVPLFHELEPVEILRIIEKLKTQIYLPQDLIIHEADKGTEMYFLIEGLAEILIKKEDKILSILLRKGAYFGEIALITNSVRTSDVKAIDFCIVEAFTKDDYEQLKLEYPDITVRLTAGLRHYKKNHLENILNILQKNELFKDIDKKDLVLISMNYMNEIFLDAQELLLKPKKRTNALYFLLLGKMQIYGNTEESRSLIMDLIQSRKQNKMNKLSVDLPNNMKFFHCLDDELFDFPHLFQDDCRLILNNIGSLVVGDMIGGIAFESNYPRSEFYYFAESACHLCVFTQASFEQLRMDRIDLYSKITDNYNKAKAYYQKLLLNDMKNFIRNSNSSPENFHINNSMIPKEFQTHLNLQKAKKSVFFDDFETKKTTNNEKIINSNMFSSTINNFQQEEEKNINPKMMNSTFVNHPIFEENSENNSDKEEENDRTSVINLLTFGESIKRKKTLSVIFEKGQKHINKRGDLVREEIRNAANDQVRKLEELELKLQALVT